MSSFESTRERIRTLEDALRPFAGTAQSMCGPMKLGFQQHVCRTHSDQSYPCIYETARRALEGE